MKLRDKAFELVSNAESLALEVANAEAGNRSANRRARKLSVIIRDKMKALRAELLKLEKGEL
jgi:hypothetical protein|tara:strand:+ start:625 stop:810 length:186 start_codon:yes stop_codon:yes gene_type:complete